MRTVPHQKRLHVGRWSESLTCFAITKCTYDKSPRLANDVFAGLFYESCNWLRTNDHIRLLGFCIMPNHYHALWVLLEGKPLDDVMRSLGRYTSRRINELSGKEERFWQDGFYDHRCRDHNEVLDSQAYIEHNPVRAGLATDAEQWPYSSAFPANADILDRAWYAERC